MENLGCVNLYEMTRKSNEVLRARLEQRATENTGKIFLFSETDGRERTSSQFDESVDRAANRAETRREND